MRSSGFTIIEVLIALAIMGVLFAVLAVTQVSTFKITRQSQVASSAMQVAATQLDDLNRKVLVDYAGYATTCASTPSDAKCSGALQATGATGAFAITADPTSFSGNSGGSDVLKITVSVTAPANVSLSTLASCIDQGIPKPPSGSNPPPPPMPTVSDHSACYAN